ncbi:DUF1905 domain-containing protein [Kineococcus terrestris]|uniref:DUF1905 domain-containing protein n=1 Tax=Kineococcus terrestris TaxID=2044856 RepID=UPI0034DB0660
MSDADRADDPVALVVEFSAPLWRWEARADEWVFARLPRDASDDVRALPRPPSGFGSVRVRVTCGASTWTTSVFPESAEGAYVVPLKRSVRRAEGIGVGDTARLRVEVLR